MALGPGWFKEKYKDMNLEELTNELESEKELYNSGEILKAEEERIKKGIDDNSPLSDYETKVGVLEELIKEKNNSKAELRKYKIDDNGNTYEEEVELKIPDPTLIYIFQLEKILNMNKEEIYNNHRRIENMNATYYWNPSRGGIALIVSDDGSFLGATSAVNFDKHLEAFKNGKRNGNCKSYNEEKNMTEDEVNKNIIDDSTEVYNFEKAKNIAKNEAQKNGKIIMEIKENENWWLFEAGLPNEQFFDDGAGSIYINKSDNSIRNLNLWDIDFTQKFNDSSKIIYDYYNENNSAKIELKTRNYKEEFDNCIISHAEFITKPPVYDIGYPVLLIHKNSNFVAWLLNNHKNFYINDDSKNNKYIPSAILVYSLNDKTSKIFKLDEFVKEFNIDILNSETNKLFDTIDINEIFNLKRSLSDDFIFLLNDGVNIDFEKYNNYFTNLLNVVSVEEKKYYDLLRIDNNDKNLNYIDDSNIIEVISVSAIEKIGIPTKQIENTILFISRENACIDNKKVSINDKIFNSIVRIIEQNINRIREIKKQQTPEFLGSHIRYDNTSKIFSIKYSNEEINISYHTEPESDKYINELINSIISVLGEQNKEIKNDDINKNLKSNGVEKEINNACELYKTTGNTNEIVSTIEKIIDVNVLNNGDVFWVDASRFVFIYLILKEFNESNECSYSKIFQILNNKELFIKKIKEANNIKDENISLKEYSTKIVNSSEKMIDSYYDIICSCLNIVPSNKENNENEIIEHVVNSNFKFKFKLPRMYGEITKKSDISFKIGNSINLMISKCSDLSKLNERATQWLENSAKTNNQNILKEKEKHYFLDNNTIEVIEKMVEKDNQRRMYKFIYFNESMIIIGFSFNLYNEKFENIINNAIISITEISNQKKVERNPFENPNKNDNSGVGEETIDPYNKTDALY